MNNGAETFFVMNPGLMSTIQDNGRFGYQWMGVPVSGVLDRFSYRAGNLLLDQNQECSCLEITMLGPTLRVLRDTEIVITGADFSPELNGQRVPMWTALSIKQNDILSMSAPDQGCRAYLCVKGGFDVPLFMDSRSTNVRLQFGGFNGRPLKQGDCLSVKKAGNKKNTIRRSLSNKYIPNYQLKVVVRIIMGPHDNYFSEDGLNTFFSSEYQLSSDSNREGFRLMGPAISFRDDMPRSIPSEASPPGGIQVRPNGQPLILMNDISGGGYARIAHIISFDLPKIAQVAPGGSIKFKEISLISAQKINQKNYCRSFYRQHEYQQL